MFGIKEIIKIYANLSPEKKHELLKKSKLDEELINYLQERFNNLKIEVLGDYSGSILELMDKGQLEGWCWQTTETAILFLNDDDFIERGNININRGGYYHSWIVFKFKGKEYVFDPCLDFLCRREVYNAILDCDVKGTVSGRKVKEYFYNYINNPPQRAEVDPKIEAMIRRLFGERNTSEIVVHDKENPNAPMYRNGAGYTAEFEGKKLQKLKVHYYYSDC